VLGRVFHDPCRRSSVLAEAWVKVGREVMEWDGIDGEALEWWSECSLDRSQVDAIRISARMQTEALARACLREQGVPSEDLVCSDIALMLTHPGDGEQCVHFDVQNYEDASRCYAFILYCSDGRSSWLRHTLFAPSTMTSLPLALSLHLRRHTEAEVILNTRCTATTQICMDPH
jgi:hypothetical protein